MYIQYMHDLVYYNANVYLSTVENEFFHFKIYLESQHNYLVLKLVHVMDSF